MKMEAWPTHLQVIEWLGHDGPPADTDRYRYAKVVVGNESLFLKEAKQTETGGSFENEVAWMEFALHLAEQRPELHCRGLVPRAYQPSKALLTEFIDAPLVAMPKSLDADFPAHLSRFVDTLIAVDAVGQGYNTSLPPRSRNSDYRQLDRGWDAWYRRLNDEFSTKYTDLVDAAKRAIKDTAPLTVCMQHGDFVPWHIFEKDEEWVIFDAEHAHHELPRFYDLAYSFSRIYTRADDSNLAKQQLALFIDRIALGETDFWQQFMPVLISRAVGVLSDALYDLPKVDYEDRARELLEACLADSKEFLAKTG